MHDTEIPPSTGARDADPDCFEADLDDVAAALDALDAEDLDTAQSLAAGLDSGDSAD